MLQAQAQTWNAPEIRQPGNVKVSTDGQMSESVARKANLSRLDAEDSRVTADSYRELSCSPEIAVEEGET